MDPVRTFDTDGAWDLALYHLRVLSLAGATVHFKLVLVNGRIHRKTLQRLNDLARPYIDQFKHQDIEAVS